MMQRQIADCECVQMRDTQTANTSGAFIVETSKTRLGADTDCLLGMGK